MVREMTGGQEDQRFLLVRSGTLKCALPASDVVRVVRGLIYHPVPGSQVRLLGLAQYGGEPLPVLDLHAVVDGSASGSRPRSTVILGRGRRRDRPILGLAVDDVLRVVSLSRESVASGDTEISADSINEDEAVRILDTQRLLADTMDDTGAMNG
jgi:chemotaxis signal transduction protein